MSRLRKGFKYYTDAVDYEGRPGKSIFFFDEGNPQGVTYFGF